ncbi:MAG: polyketide synthase dehydratase domain-containing protein, partial [Verrucomicrobia bacterium]|nr:polyketide synthase dehydratase domain-containing protein [Verrucomicrobiota bacterium]
MSARTGTVLASMRRGQDERTTLLNSLGSLYTLGRSADWKALYTGGGHCVSLPPYPWQRERHWVNLSSGSTAQSSPAIAWPGRTMRSPFFAGVVTECVTSSSNPRFIDEHRFSGVPIVPATAIIDLALVTALRALRKENALTDGPKIRGGEALLLENFAIDQGIVLPENEARALQLGFRPEGLDAGSFQLFSRPAAQTDADADWIQHAAGSVRLGSATDTASRSQIESQTLNDAQTLCPETVEVEDHYRTMQTRGIEFGPLFRGIKALWRGEQSGLARIDFRPNPDAESSAHVVHPAMLDACLQAIAPVLPDDGTGAYLPRTIERLWLSGKMGAARWSFARLRSNSEIGDGTVIADVWIFDAAGQPTGIIYGVRLQRTTSFRLTGLKQSAPKRSLYEICWEEQPLKESTEPQTENYDRSCLIFADRGGIAEQFCETAARRRVKCLIVHAGDGFSSTEEGLFGVAPSKTEDFSSLIRELRRRGQWPVQDVVHFWTLDQPRADANGARALSAEQMLSVGSVLHLVQAMNAELTGSPRLWLVSRSAVPLETDSLLVEPTQAPVWGLGHTISLEHPEFRCTKVDLHGEKRTISIAVDQLCNELFCDSPAENGDHEDRLILAEGKRFVARLRPLGQRLESPVPVESSVTSVALRAAPSGVLEDLRWTPCERRGPAS